MRALLTRAHVELQPSKENSVACRYDWHQTGSQVVISVFAKASLPDKSYVDLNPVKCKIHIVFGENRSVFDTELLLGGVRSSRTATFVAARQIK